MFATVKSTVIALTLASAALVAAGCQSTGSAPAAAAAPGKAVACDKCKTTFVESKVTNDKGRVVAYTQKPTMACPECRSAAENFFATGKLQHDCKTCGPMSLQECAMH